MLGIDGTMETVSRHDVGRAIGLLSTACAETLFVESATHAMDAIQMMQFACRARCMIDEVTDRKSEHDSEAANTGNLQAVIPAR